MVIVSELLLLSLWCVLWVIMLRVGLCVVGGCGLQCCEADRYIHVLL